MSTKFELSFGDKWKLLNHLPTIEHHLFFQYLLVSPSYYRAHQIRHNQAELKGLPKDFEKVLKVYDFVGDIFLTPFEVWWEKTGCELFYSGAQSKHLTLNIDLTNTKEQILQSVGNKLDEAIEKFTNSKPPKLHLLNNKIHTFSIFEKMRVLEEKAESYVDDDEKFKNWQIALIANLETKWRKGLTINSSLTSRNEVARNYLTMLVSKNLAEALIISENAARGNFPSKKPISSKLSFDYEILSEILSDYERVEIKFIHDMTVNEKDLKFRSYWEMMNKKKRAKRKALDKLEKRISKEIEIRKLQDEI